MHEPNLYGRLADRMLTTIGVAWRPGPGQAPPPGDWDIWMLKGGRGSGKTEAGARYVNDHAMGRPCFPGPTGHRIAVISPTLGDARATAVEGESGLLHHNPAIDFNRSNLELRWPSGAKGKLFGASQPDDVERLRGPQHCLLWCEEFAAWRQLDATWNIAQFGLRLGRHPRVVITTTPKPRKLMKELAERAGTVVVRIKTSDNVHLPPDRVRKLYEQYAGSRLGRQELLAEDLEDVQGALWTLETIEETREALVPDLKRIVVALDPAVSDGEDSAETGIIVAGMDGQTPPHAYVLEDLTVKGTPRQWALVALGAYTSRKADRLVAEVNNGGDMIEAVLRGIDPNVAYRALHASRGKRTRAEPVSALYEQGRVHHVRVFPELEDQMTTWVPDEDTVSGTKKQDSPDRMDALVWAITELMVDAGAVHSSNTIPGLHPPVRIRGDLRLVGKRYADRV